MIFDCFYMTYIIFILYRSYTMKKNLKGERITNLDGIAKKSF